MTGAQIQAMIAGIPAYGMVAVAIGATLFPGIPEEAFLLVVGYMVGTGAAPFWSTLWFLLIGFWCVDMVLFALARRDFAIFRTLQRRVFGITEINPDGFIVAHLERIVFLSRFALYVRWIGPVLAGRLRMKWSQFLIVDALALLVYVPAMLGIGIYFRSRIEALVAGVNTVGNIIGIVLAVVFLISAIVWGTKQFRRRVKTGATEPHEHWFLGFRKKK